MRGATIGLMVIMAGTGVYAQEANPANRIKPSIVLSGQVDRQTPIDSQLLLTLREVPTSWGPSNRAFAIESTLDFSKLWLALNRPTNLPEIDFSQWTALVVFKRASDLMIVESNGQAVFDYKIRTPVNQDQAYTIVVFPREAVNLIR